MVLSQCKSATSCHSNASQSQLNSLVSGQPASAGAFETSGKPLALHTVTHFGARVLGMTLV